MKKGAKRLNQSSDSQNISCPADSRQHTSLDEENGKTAQWLCNSVTLLESHLSLPGRGGNPPTGPSGLGSGGKAGLSPPIGDGKGGRPPAGPPGLGREGAAPGLGSGGKAGLSSPTDEDKGGRPPAGPPGVGREGAAPGLGNEGKEGSPPGPVPEAGGKTPGLGGLGT